MTSSVRSLAVRTAKLFELGLFPSRCKICRRLLASPGETVLCRPCLDTIVPHRPSLCPRCGRYFEGAGRPHLCASCLNDPPPFSCHRSGGRYRGTLKDAILLLKYRRYRPLADPLARFLYSALGKEEEVWQGVDLIVPVPLHRRRRRDRGFNQAGVLAKSLGRLSGLRVEPGALRKIKHVPPQTSLEHRERAANVRGVFSVAKPEAVDRKVVLLVDDVYTTGATLRECAAALAKAGAKDVRGITLAQA